jgi:putative aldouronate transport system permease protein
VGVYNVIVARTFFQTTIPEELFEAAEIDGCSDLRFLGLIAVPLSMPIIAVLVMFYAVGFWNSYFSAMIYLSDKKKYPLQLVMRNLLILNTADPAMVSQEEYEKAKQLVLMLKYAMIVVATVPMMILYPFIQKYFVKGVMIGSIKG